MPDQTSNPITVITDLIELARRINLALDDSEEFEGSDGRTHAITAQHFDDICDAIHWLEALPDNKPGETLSPAGKAEWALRDLIQESMGAPSADTLYLLRRLLSNQHTFTGSEFRAELTAIVEAANVQQPPTAAQEHPDDMAVDRFAAAMKEKLAQARAKGRNGWNTPECTQLRLSDMLREHVEKGDPRDVANFCMFLWCRGEAITSQSADIRAGENYIADFFKAKGYFPSLAQSFAAGAARTRPQPAATAGALVALPSPDIFRKALRMAQRESLERKPPRYLNDEQADASMSDAADELKDCYIAALATQRGGA